MESPTGRSLRLDPEDGRPSSAFGADWLRPLPLIGGLLSTVLIPGASALVLLATFLVKVVLVFLFSLLSQCGHVDGDAQDAEPVLEEEDVIEARFVQLGRDFEHELPNREVPILATAPPEPSEVPTEETPPPDPEQPEPPPERPPDAVDSDIAQLIARSGVFAEMAQPQELEGDPEGIEEGTEREGTEGDLYRGRVMSFFRRGWTIPTTLSTDEVRGLTTVMDVSIGPELQIVSFEVRRSSENPVFDESVVQQLTRLQASDGRIPPPPEEVADQYIGRTIAVRFRGRDAR